MGQQLAITFPYVPILFNNFFFTTLKWALMSGAETLLDELQHLEHDEQQEQQSHTWTDIQILLRCQDHSLTGFYTPRSSWTCRSNCRMLRRRRWQRSARGKTGGTFDSDSIHSCRRASEQKRHKTARRFVSCAGKSCECKKIQRDQHFMRWLSWL